MPKVAVIQLNTSDNVAANLRAIYGYLQAAQQGGAELALLPENFAWMGCDQDSHDVPESYGLGPIQDFLAQASQELGLWIIGGSIRLKSTLAKLTNTLLVYNPSGECCGRYDKIHLFDAVVASGEAYRESDSFEAGNQIQLCDTPLGPTGLSICYDLRFPRLFQALVNRGAKVIVVPAAFAETTGQVHWQPLLQARAIENQVYILAAAQTGEHANERHTHGHSMVIDPWGRIIQDAGKQPGVTLVDIDLALVDEIRQKMPVFSHKCSDIVDNTRIIN